MSLANIEARVIGSRVISVIEERGRVVAIGHDGIWVETVQRSGCHGCAAKSGCGTGLLGDFWASASRVFVPVDSAQHRQIALHDTVRIGIAENTLASSALVVYLLPLVTMLLGALGGEALAAEAGAISGAVVGLLTGGVAVRLYGYWNRRNPAFVPQFLGLERSHPCAVPASLK